MNCRYDKFLECDKPEDKREIHCEYCPHYDPPGPAQHAAQGIQRHRKLQAFKENRMNNETFITDFVDGLDSETLLEWCDVMTIPHNVVDWRGVDETLDDDHPDKVDDLRTALVTKFLLVDSDLPRLAPQMTPADLARHIAKGEQRHQEYNYTETEDRLTLKLDMLRDKLRDLTSAELKELESGLDAFTRMAELFLKRHGTPTEPERPEPDTKGPCTNWTPHGQAETFQSRCEQSKNPIPLETDVDKINFGGLIKLADDLGVRHDENQWLNDEWRDREGELRAAVAEAMEKVGK